VARQVEHPNNQRSPELLYSLSVKGARMPGILMKTHGVIGTSIEKLFNLLTKKNSKRIVVKWVTCWVTILMAQVSLSPG